MTKINTSLAKKPPAPMYSAVKKLDVFGIDAVVAELIAGNSLTGIAKAQTVGVASLISWIEADAERAALAREARAQSAKIWDEKAEYVLQIAGDPFELAKARELASHYRWRAKAVAPRDYGEKVTNEHTGAGGGPITLAAVDLTGLSDAELVQMQTLLGKTTT
jgi:hypothetical protein